MEQVSQEQIKETLDRFRDAGYTPERLYYFLRDNRSFNWVIIDDKNDIILTNAKSGEIIAASKGLWQEEWRKALEPLTPLWLKGQEIQTDCFYPCTCDLHLLMREGCQCGGV
jgi:hypothetical protein